MCECVNYDDGSRYLCVVCSEMVDEQVERLKKAMVEVDRQAEDDLLWHEPEENQSTAEMKDQIRSLQYELRKLHMEIEGGLNNPFLRDPF